MAKTAIETDFQSSKMAAGGHFVKKKVVHWSEMARNAIESDAHFICYFLMSD